MVPCVEILLCTSAVRNCIRENRIYEIPNIIETSRRLGMQSMDDSIAEMYFKGFIDREEAIVRSSNPGKMEKTLVGRRQDERRVAGGGRRRQVTEGAHGNTDSTKTTKARLWPKHGRGRVLAARGKARAATPRPRAPSAKMPRSWASCAASAWSSAPAARTS